MAAAVGSDARGTDLIDELAGYGVDTSLVQRVDRETSEFLCVIDPDGDRTFLLNPNQAAFSLDRISESAAGDAGYCFVGCRLSLAERVLNQAKPARTGSFANIGFWIASGELGLEQAPILERFDCLFLNDDEFDEMPKALRDWIASSEFLDETRRVIVTGGAAEAVVLTAGGTVALAPAPNPEIVNTLGCGDAFMAGYLAAHIGGVDIEGCLALAHECAGRIASSPLERYPDQFDALSAATRSP
jgi:ribokinase